jgi:hypothetical protein
MSNRKKHILFNVDITLPTGEKLSFVLPSNRLGHFESRFLNTFREYNTWTYFPEYNRPIKDFTTPEKIRLRLIHMTVAFNQHYEWMKEKPGRANYLIEEYHRMVKDN